MVVVPQLGGHEQLLATNSSVREQLLERGTDVGLVPIPLGGVEVSETDFDRGLDRVSRLRAVGQRGAKPEGRHPAVPVVQVERDATQSLG